jgi:hypothetical protein
MQRPILKKHPLIAYIEGHTRVVETTKARTKSIVVDLGSRVVIMKNIPEAKALRELIKLNTSFTAAARDSKASTQKTFDPLDGRQHTRMDIDKWIKGLHADWLAGLGDEYKGHPQAKTLTNQAAQMLSLRFMAVAANTGLVKLKTPEAFFEGESAAVIAQKKEQGFYAITTRGLGEMIQELRGRQPKPALVP